MAENDNFNAQAAAGQPTKEEKIRAYLERVAQKQEDKKNQVLLEQEEKKNRILRKAGLTFRVYNPTGGYSDEYQKYDSDREMYYKAVPINVSDEEWKQISSAYQTECALDSDETDETGDAAGSGNGIAGTLKAIGIIVYIAAFIAGIVLGYTYGRLLSRGDFFFGAALAVWIAGFVMGTMMLGFSEIIRLLHEINRKTPD